MSSSKLFHTITVTLAVEKLKKFQSFDDSDARERADVRAALVKALDETCSALYWNDDRDVRVKAIVINDLAVEESKHDE
jgi:hypothetical protein